MAKIFIFGAEENEGTPVILRKDDMAAMIPDAIVSKVYERWDDGDYLAIFFPKRAMPEAYSDGRIKASMTLSGTGKDENYGSWWYRELSLAGSGANKGEMVLSIGKRLYAIIKPETYSAIK